METPLILSYEESKRRGAVTKFISELKDEGKQISYLAGPMVAVTICTYLVQVASSMMVGHLGELALSSSAIATSLAGVTGFSFLLGMSSGLETLCGQAFGAKQYKKLAVQTYSAIFSLLLLCIPIAVIWLYIGHFLAFIGQDPEISLRAGKYTAWMIPGLFAYAIAMPLIKFLQSQSITFPLVLTSFLTLCFHIPLCWILVFHSRLGYLGAALSISLSYWFNVFFLVIYIKYSKECELTCAPFSVDVFKGIHEFMRIALPSAFMICLEWWSFELLVLLSGLLPNPKLETSVLSICLTSISCLYTIPYGIGAAASTRVSNELGAGNHEKARSAVRIVMLIAVTEAIIVSSSLYMLRRFFGSAYSNDEEVVDYVMDMAPLVCIAVVVDSLQGVLSGIARGCGWQHIGAYVNLGAYYLFGIPVAVVLGFILQIRGKGLWIGIVSGALVQTVSLAIITICTNWEQQAIMARERVYNEKLPLEAGHI